MRSFTSLKFWKAFEKLPVSVKDSAKSTFRLWQNSPFHPSLQFKRVHSVKPIFSVRIGLDWRALGIKNNEDIIWFWIGSHEEYNQMINSI